MESTFFSEGKYIKGSSFKTSEGTEEFYLTINSNDKTFFSHELDDLYDKYMIVMEKHGLTEDTQIFARFYISDIANQKDKLIQSKIFDVAQKGAVSIIQQCPINGGSVSLLVYHITSKTHSFKKKVMKYNSESWRNGSIIYGKNYDLVWIANFSGIGNFDSYEQTSEVFQSFNNIIEDNGMTLFDNSIKTWVYVRDIDNHYMGMVNSRKAFFEKHGLTPETRYIASTGIEGTSKEVNSLVSLDVFSINRLRKEQIIRMDALENLSPTIKYGVTFERGLRVRFGDRSHLHISGTASIDKNGDVIHVSDVSNQTRRTLDNVKALLSPHGASLKDMAYIIVYLRDFKDKKKVMEVLEKEIPQNVPFLCVVGAVCRPAWLVEMEGIAIIPDSNDFPAFF